ncbi:hypothetical protein GQ457_18G018970 [Hibiscus cannabinus]
MVIRESNKLLNLSDTLLKMNKLRLLKVLCPSIVELNPYIFLNVVNLKGSENLIHTPDSIPASNLEFLILKGCTRLVDVHWSVRLLEMLKLLNLKD